MTRSFIPHALAVIGILAGLFSVGCGDDGAPADETGSTTTGASSTTGAWTSIEPPPTGVETDFDPPVLPDEPFGGGDRLRPNVLTAPGGGEVILSFHDTELDLDCNFVKDRFNTWRCLPTDGTRAWEVWPHDLYGIDQRDELTWFSGYAPSAADCETNVAVVSECRAQPGDLVALPVRPACGPGPAPREVFELSAPATEIGDADDACNPIPLGEGEVAFETTGIELDDYERYVGAIELDTGTVRRVIADDGAWIHITLLALDKHPCAVLPSSYCAATPAAIELTTHYADPDCEFLAGGLLVTPDEDCVFTPQLAITNGEIRSVLDTLGTRWFRDPDTNECLEQEFDGVPMYALSEPRPEQTLAPTLVFDDGDGPVVARRRARGQQSPLTVEGFWHVARDEACEVLRTPSGHACVPASLDRGFTAAEGTGFADDACTMPVYATNGDALPVLMLDATGGPCPDEREPGFFEPTAHTDPVYVLDDEGTCVVTRETWDHVYVPGAQVDASDWLTELSLATQ